MNYGIKSYEIILILRFTMFLQIKNYPNEDNKCVFTSAKLEN